MKSIKQRIDYELNSGRNSTTINICFKIEDVKAIAKLLNVDIKTDSLQTLSIKIRDKLLKKTLW